MVKLGKILMGNILLISQMEILMKDNGTTIKSMEKEHSDGLMAEFIMVNTKTTLCLEKELLHFQMVSSIRGSFSMINFTVMEL